MHIARCTCRCMAHDNHSIRLLCQPLGGREDLEVPIVTAYHPGCNLSSSACISCQMLGLRGLSLRIRTTMTPFGCCTSHWVAEKIWKYLLGHKIISLPTQVPERRADVQEQPPYDGRCMSSGRIRHRSAAQSATEWR